ncbi:MAG TPA: DUF4231 domain-containing protein [Ignavibacteria bacterium]|nr:DUF4231 domain-containing protein [Ignavibacteria bacterium]HMR41821.1 DUF4231 domain-containing protein [Ignavibacteria bacterium]
MKTIDYPSTYQAADEISISSQKHYVRLMRLDLIFMLIASLVVIYDIKIDSLRLWEYILTGLFLLMGLIITIILKYRRYEDFWYQGRAVAESIKTLTWRYITCSENFDSTLSQEKADEIFLDSIGSICKELNDLEGELSAKILNLPVITERMREERNKNLEDRKSLYIKYRIQDQKNWYSQKAEYNLSKKNFWFLVIIVSQIFGIISCVFLIKYPMSDWNLIGFFITISTSAIAWLQLKQHQELKQAYTTATLELNLIEEKSFSIRSEEDLSRFVLDSENAISREHTLWLAQRRK